MNTQKIKGTNGKEEYFTFRSNEKEEKISQMRQMMRKVYTYEQSQNKSRSKNFSDQFKKELEEKKK